QDGVAQLRASSVERERALVDVAPHPVLARLGGADQRVGRLVEVRGRVAVRRVVAAADLAAHEALAEVHPVAADLEALLAPGHGPELTRDGDLVEVRADGFHGPWPPVDAGRAA